MTEDPVGRSVAFLETVRAGEPWDDESLAATEPDRLAAALDSDDALLAFWCNVYNAAAQRALAADPSRYERRRRFFRTPLVTVAGHDLSLDDVEHAILRRGYSKLALGYLQWPLWRGFPATVAPSERDPRVHFALNCGAASCPLIRAYSRASVGDELDRATLQYLAETVEYDPEAGRARVPRVFLWFRGDFGGKRGILAFLRRFDALPADASPRLEHRPWDWSASIGEFA